MQNRMCDCFANRVAAVLDCLGSTPIERLRSLWIAIFIRQLGSFSNEETVVLGDKISPGTKEMIQQTSGPKQKCNTFVSLETVDYRF